MPRKPRRCPIKQEPLGPPMRTRSMSKSPKPSKMPPLAALTLNQLDIGAEATPVAPASPPAKEAAAAAAPALSPSSRSKRRKREAITLPPTLARSSLSRKELRRLKNRISANRVRTRSQQAVRHMEEQLEAYRERCEFLETVVSGCSTCAIVSAVQFGEIELLPAFKTEGTDEELELELDECIVLGNALHC